jgi:hypothetical protein
MADPFTKLELMYQANDVALVAEQAICIIKLRCQPYTTAADNGVPELIWQR